VAIENCPPTSRNKAKSIMAVAAMGEIPMPPVIAESCTVVMLVFVRMA
jgi:hypothetical protein